MQGINDELMIPCAQCCRKHLSAAIAHYADAPCGGPAKLAHTEHVLVARALINLCEADQGYASHRVLAVGLAVEAEVAAPDPAVRSAIRQFRLGLTGGDECGYPFCITDEEWYLAHVAEAGREFPDIVTAVARDPFYRDNMSEPELRQAEVNYRLAQLAWLDENVFGLKATEKGEEQMACAKKAVKAAAKGGKAKATVAKKGGKCKACGK